MEHVTWNKKQLGEQMIIKESKRRLVVAVFPVTTSSPFFARESLLIGDGAKQLDIKTPDQRGVLNTQSSGLKVHSDISRGSPALTPTSRHLQTGWLHRVELQTSLVLGKQTGGYEGTLQSGQHGQMVIMDQRYFIFNGN